MDGVGGKPAWAWIFILEGLATVIASLISFFVIPDFPDAATFLTEEERAFVIHRLQEDDRFSAGGEELKMRYIVQSLSDWQTWVGSESTLCPFNQISGRTHIDGPTVFLLAGTDGALYAFSLFLPSIINQVSDQCHATNLHSH